MMATMKRSHRIKFWQKNGYSLMEAVELSKNELSRKVILVIKKIRTENDLRKNGGLQE